MRLTLLVPLLLLAVGATNPGASSGSKLVFFELTVKDLSRAKAFYGQLFHWSFRDSPSPDFVAIEGAGVGGGLLRDAQKVPGAGDVKVFFQVDDVERNLRHAQALGAEVLLPATKISPTRTLGEFRDADGNIIGMIHDVQR